MCIRDRFNTPEGKQYIKDELGMSDEEIEKMSWLGISGIANVLCCIKTVSYTHLASVAASLPRMKL